METMRKNIEELLRWMTGGKYGLDNLIFKIKGDSKSPSEQITSSDLQETKPVVAASEQETKPFVPASEQETKPAIAASEQAMRPVPVVSTLEMKPAIAASERETKPVVAASSVLIRKRQRNDREEFIPKRRFIDRISQICIVCLGVCLICLILFGVIYLIILWVMK